MLRGCLSLLDASHAGVDGSLLNSSSHSVLDAGIESSGDMSGLYHGECVALGLVPMCGDSIRPRVIDVLKKCGLYNLVAFDWDKIAEAAFHDKKADGDLVTVTMVPEVGSFVLKTMKCTDVIDLAKSCLKE